MSAPWQKIIYAWSDGTTAQGSIFLSTVCKVKRVMVGVFCLSLVKAYNKCMDRVDLTGMLKVLFRIDYRSKAW
ncbi:hypothetical protein T4D_9058 [Trichinella pseudospiralis]|uniref:PiggyBac transposable element-derived protein domain-containing protein n=1 Tax=Trichinella pseudospiralis TaxID=6337 RepID=A0A0V1FC88_TRIPS|nr:hypothetical protein T4D_9058 [Trichinella pseudospiralis]